MNLPQLAQDKANHFIYGQSMFVVLAWVIWKATGHYNIAYWSAELAVIAAALTKEILDKRSNRKAIAAGQNPSHGVEGWDAAATALGGLSI